MDEGVVGKRGGCSNFNTEPLQIDLKMTNSRKGGAVLNIEQGGFSESSVGGGG